MTLNEATAITLRIVYLGAAVILAFLVNRFFFPIRKEALFTHNIKALLLPAQSLLGYHPEGPFPGHGAVCIL